MRFFTLIIILNINYSILYCEGPPRRPGPDLSFLANINDPFTKTVVYSNLLENKVAIMHELKGQSGVYLFLNHVNGHYYIGSSVDLSHRFSCHIAGYNSNVVLQK